jgi:hypothetical protein
MRLVKQSIFQNVLVETSRSRCQRGVLLTLQRTQHRLEQGMAKELIINLTVLLLLLAEIQKGKVEPVLKKYVIIM